MTRPQPEIRCFVGAQDKDGRLLSPLDQVRLEIRFPGPALPCPESNECHFGWVELSANQAIGLANMLSLMAVAAARQESPAFAGPTSHDLRSDAINCLRDLHDLLWRGTPNQIDIATQSPEIAEMIATRLQKAKDLLALLPDTRPQET